MEKQPNYINNPTVTKNMDIYSVLQNITQPYQGHLRIKFYPNDGETPTVEFLHYYQKTLNRGVSVNNALLNQLSDDAKMCYNEIAKIFKEKTGKLCPLKFVSEDTNCEIVGVNNRHSICIKQIYNITDPKFSTGKEFQAK